MSREEDFLDDADSTTPPPAPRVLLAEDDTALLGVLTELLAEAGCDVTPAPDGRAAIECLGALQFDVVLTDIQMPDATGVDVLRAVRQHDLDTHVILMTGNPSLPTAVEALRLGAVGYLAKPVPTPSLIEAVREASRLARLGRLRREALAELGGAPSLSADRAGLESMLERARAGLFVAYQPVLWARDGTVFAHEALVRSTSVDAPDAASLLRLAERLGEVRPLGRQIRERIARDLEILEGAVLVNLHPFEISDPGLVGPGEPLARLSDRVVLEISEQAPLGVASGARDVVSRLRQQGYRIAVDDLGAGYAALSSFASVEPDIVKIDMSLVRGIDSQPKKRKIVGSIVELCRDLEILVIGEGVEAEAERQALVEVGCDLLQGFLLGRPRRVAR